MTILLLLQGYTFPSCHVFVTSVKEVQQIMTTQECIGSNNKFPSH